MENYSAEIMAYVANWAASTEKIVGYAIKKSGIKVSEASQRNITIDVIQGAFDTIGIKIIARDALRFVDMGAGRGWHKGKKVSVNTSSRKKKTENPRIKKSIWNRPLYKRIARLQEVVTVQTIEKVISTFQEEI